MTTRTAELVRTAALLAERSDGELLDLFVRHRDEGAFADVVRRHGPMVLGVCRRVLRDSPDADDAFQAAFLVLARRAGSIASADRLANWLHGVAFNTARKLRRANARRFRRVTLPGNLPDTPSLPDPPRDWCAVLDDELTRLPEKYRTPIVLCDLEGLTRTEAARTLGCPEGTVAGRLARARDLLGRRLAARGVVPGVVVAVVVPQALVSASARAAAGGVTPSCVAAISDGVIRTMVRKKLGTAAALVAAAVAAVAGLGALPTAAQTPPPPAKATAPSVPLRGFIPAERTLTAFPLRALTPEKAVKELEKYTAAVLVPVPDHKTLLVYTDPKTRGEIEDDLRKWGEVRAVPTVVRLHKLKADETAKKLTTLLADRAERPAVVPVPGEETLLVFASEEKTRKIFAFLADLDFATAPSRNGTVFALKNASAADVARQLRDVFNGPGKDAKRVTITAIPGANQILVHAGASDTAAVRQLIEKFDAPEPMSALKFDPPRETLYSLNFDATPWASVFDWYAKTTGLAFVSSATPTGTVTLKPAKDRLYPLGEVTDLLNEVLVQQKWLLVRREKTFTVIPADEKPDRSLFRPATPNELPRLGKTELVEVVLRLADYKMTVKDDAAEIKKLLGGFGQMDTVEARNVVVVRDTAGNVARLLKVIRPAD